MRASPLLLFAALLCPAFASASPDPAKVGELARSKRWLRLLHYKSHWLTGFRSSVDGPGFFFAPEGAKSPEAELLATVHAFRHRQGESFGKLSQPPACAFPARFRFLNEELGLGLAMPECPRWKEFLARFRDPQGLTLVFSSAYPNNPASMFGHTFLRVNGKGRPGQEKLDLLDYGLGYAAVVGDDENPFVFAWSGLTGGYIGSFSAVPYYAKVFEYNDSESRDIWEYDLDFTPEQTWWVLANVWELEVNSYKEYYFFDENCSYEILALLEAARPDWDVSSYFMHMIPGESVKRVVAVPGAVKAVKLRPSLYRRLLALGERIPGGERPRFFRVLRGEEIAGAPAATLEAAAAYFHYLRQQGGGALGTAESVILEKVLLERSTIREHPPEPVFDDSSRPDRGHHPGRVSLGLGRMQGSGGAHGWFQELGMRFAYHDLLNSDLGYVPFSQINFPNVNARYFPSEQRLLVSRVEAFSIYSLSPWSWLKSSFSWVMKSAYEVPQDLCSFCHVWHTEAGIGLSQPLAADRVRLYQLVGGYTDLGKPLARRWRAGPKLFLGGVANVTSRWKQQLEATLSLDPVSGGGRRFFGSVLWGQSYAFSQSWEARAFWTSTQVLHDAVPSRSEAQAQILLNF